MIRIAPSILTSDFTRLDRQIASLAEAGADWIHLDVMDGHFVPNLTFGPPVIASVRGVTSLTLDTHLMIEDPDRWLEAYRKAGADVITVHAEACRHLHRTVHRIRELGALAGVSLNPATPVAMVEEVIGDVDLILVMSVNPGFGGQTFIPASLRRITALADAVRTAGAHAVIEVDGGIDADTARQVVAAGAEVLVAGSYIFEAPSMKEGIASLRASAAEGLRTRSGDAPRIA